MNFSKYYNKAFIGGYWMVGLRFKKDESLIYKKVNAPKGQWLADPFLYEQEGRHFLFVEQYFCDKNRAGIGVYEIVDGELINNHIIIDNSYHMSYPCVFYHNGYHYMIPESSSNQSLDLYKAIDFPFEWEFETTLVGGKRMVDTTVLNRDNEVFLFSYETLPDFWILHVYLLDMNTYILSKVSEIQYNDNIGRPAGNFFEKNGRLFRPAQNCSTKYGESLLVYEVLELNKNSYVEKFSYEIQSQEISFEERFERVHTYNMDSCYETIDVFQEQFDLFHWWKIFKRHFLKM